jgi:hypothetical protein
VAVEGGGRVGAMAPGACGAKPGGGSPGGEERCGVAEPGMVEAAARGAEAVGAGGREEREALRAHAADEDGLVELEALQAALRGGECVEAALARVQAERRLVDVILSNHALLVVDGRDTVARRVLGEKRANTLFRAIMTPAFLTLVAVMSLACSIAFPASLLGKLNPRIVILLWFFEACVLASLGSSVFAIAILHQLLQRWLFWFLLAHLSVIALGGLFLFDDLFTGVMWALTFGTVFPVLLCFDSVPQKLPRTMALNYVLVLGAVVAAQGGLFFHKFSTHPVHFKLFDQVISVGDRVQASLFCFAVFLGRFAATSLFSPDCLVICRGLKSAKVPRAVADAVRHVYEYQEQAAGTGPVTSREEPMAAGPGLGRSGAAVAPALCLGDGLERAARASLQESRGDQAAARKLLLYRLDEMLLPGTHKRRNSLVIQQELSSSWRDANSRDAQRVLLPRATPVVILHPGRTIAAALGGPRLANLCFRVCRSPLFRLITTVVLFAFCLLMIYILSIREGHSEASCAAFYALSAGALLCKGAEILLLNTVVLRGTVLNNWDTWFSLVNVYLVAAIGALLFKEEQQRATWAIGQISMSLSFFHDAAAPTTATRRLLGYFLVAYVLFQLFSLCAMCVGLFNVHETVIVVFGVDVQLKGWCFAAQINVVVIAGRFAYRALSNQRNLVFVDGLQYTRMLPVTARGVRAVIHAEHLFAQHAHRSAGAT